MKTKLHHKDLKKMRDLYGITRKEITVITGFGLNVWAGYEKDVKVFNNISRSNETLIKILCDPEQFLYYLEQLSYSQIDRIGIRRYKELLKVCTDINKRIEEKLSGAKEGLINALFENKQNKNDTQRLPSTKNSI